MTTLAEIPESVDAPTSTRGVDELTGTAWKVFGFDEGIILDTGEVFEFDTLPVLFRSIVKERFK